MFLGSWVMSHDPLSTWRQRQSLNSAILSNLFVYHFFYPSADAPHPLLGGHGDDADADYGGGGCGGNDDDGEVARWLQLDCKSVLFCRIELCGGPGCPQTLHIHPPVCQNIHPPLFPFIKISFLLFIKIFIILFFFLSKYPSSCLWKYSSCFQN